MNKLILFLLIMILLGNIVLAADVDVSQVKIYINNERYYDADEAGGDIWVMPADTLEFVVGINNNLNKTVSTKIYTVIKLLDDGSNMVKQIDYFDITAMNGRSKTISYIIPTNAEYSDYTMLMTVYYKTNSTNEKKIDINYVVYVKRKSTASVNNQDAVGMIAVGLNKTLNNFSNMYSGMMSSLKFCYYELNRSKYLTDKLSECKENLGKNISELKDSQESYKSLNGNYNKCLQDQTDWQSKVTSKNNEIEQLKAQMGGMYTPYQCSNITQTEVAAVKKSSNNTMMFIIGAGVVALIIWQQKKKNLSVSENMTFGRQM